jgi:hypothetical protein
MDGNFNTKRLHSSLWNKILQEKRREINHKQIYNIRQGQKNIHVFNTLVSRKRHATVKYKVVFNEETKAELSALVDRNYKMTIVY